MLQISSALYCASYPDFASLPPPSYPEIALLGRSNVGKSSLINFICRRKQLAKISRSPGKTRSMNYFLINREWYLVDFPGYGYAKVSHKERELWQQNLRKYLRQRRSLRLVCLLVDASIAPQALDLTRLAELLDYQLKVALIFTKIDKVKARELQSNVTNFLSQTAFTPAKVLVSARENLGHLELMQVLAANIA